MTIFFIRLIYKYIIMILINPILICSMKSTGFTKRWYTEVTELKMSMCIFNLIHTMKKKKIHYIVYCFAHRVCVSGPAIDSQCTFCTISVQVQRACIYRLQWWSQISNVSRQCGASILSLSVRGRRGFSSEPRTRGVYAFSMLGLHFVILHTPRDSENSSSPYVSIIFRWMY